MYTYIYIHTYIHKSLCKHVSTNINNVNTTVAFSSEHATPPTTKNAAAAWRCTPLPHSRR